MCVKFRGEKVLTDENNWYVGAMMFNFWVPFARYVFIGASRAHIEAQ